MCTGDSSAHQLNNCVVVLPQFAFAIPSKRKSEQHTKNYVLLIVIVNKTLITSMHDINDKEDAVLYALLNVIIGPHVSSDKNREMIQQIHLRQIQ